MFLPFLCRPEHGVGRGLDRLQRFVRRHGNERGIAEWPTAKIRYLLPDACAFGFDTRPDVCGQERIERACQVSAIGRNNIELCVEGGADNQLARLGAGGHTEELMVTTCKDRLARKFHRD